MMLLNVVRKRWWLVLLVTSVVGLRSLWSLTSALKEPEVYQKDFVQEYLLSRATLDHVNLYVARGTLASRYGLPDVPLAELPTPHPPPVVLLFLPLALVTYPLAAGVWQAIELGLLAVSALLLLSSAHVRPSPLLVVGLTSSVVALYPFRVELAEGQLMVLLVALLAAARLALLTGRPALGGALVGAATLVKFVPWPLLLFFAIRRDWRSLGAGVLTVALGYLVTLVVVGPGTIAQYFAEALPANSAADAVRMSNFSAWTIGARLFEGIGSPDKLGGTGPVLVRAPAVASLLTPIVPAAILLAALAWSAKDANLDRGLCLMLCVSILVSPIAWQQYLVLATLAVAYLSASVLRSRPVFSTWTAVSVASLVLLYLPWGWWWNVGHLIVGESLTRIETWTMLSGPAAILTMGPIIALGVFCLSLAIGRRTPGVRVQPAQEMGGAPLSGKGLLHQPVAEQL